jgi:hypothetical protein
MDSRPAVTVFLPLFALPELLGVDWFAERLLLTAVLSLTRPEMLSSVFDMNLAAESTSSDGLFRCVPLSATPTPAFLAAGRFLVTDDIGVGQVMAMHMASKRRKLVV